jgi:sigma-B regulation protein RsbU (phosphoserine phosphatase)
MNQRKLYKTIEGFASATFGSSQELLLHVLRHIVQNDRLEMTGGRLWKLNQQKFAYELVGQVGDVEKIKPNFSIKVEDYRLFKQLPEQKTILGNETNPYLREKGIKRFSATGVGELATVKGIKLFPYVISFNTRMHQEELIPTLNIIGVAVTTILRNRSVQKKQELLQKDLDKAADIQRSILPEHEKVFHSYEMFGVSIADRIVGGDFFDYIESVDDDRIGIVVGDAASKGISAAVQALYVSGALRMGADYETKISSLMRRINGLVHRTFSDERFLTLFYAELSNDKKGLCVYANAGHNAPILYHPKTEQFEFLEATGQILGPFPDQRYRSEGVMISKGDVLVLYTDGVSEAMDSEGRMYTEQRLAQKIRENAGKSAKEITQLIIEDVQVFSTKSKYSDDKTVVTIKRRK